MPKIELLGVAKSFGQKAVLRGVDLRLMPGESLVVIGGSGTGKSVTLKCILGLEKPDAGEIRIDGMPAEAVDRRAFLRRTGMLFQGGALFDSMTALENVAFPLRTFTRQSEAEVMERVHWCLEVVGLPDVGPKKPSEISGGMQKRVALARAIALEPKYILYDEPTSGLDPQTSATINDLIVHLAETLRATSVVITHDMNSVLRIADRAGFIHEQRLHWIGTMEELHCCADEATLAFVRASEYTIGQPQHP